MNELYKVTITKNGETVKEIETDCIMAVMNRPGDNTTAVWFASKCTGKTIFETFMAIEKLKNDVIETCPEVGLLASVARHFKDK